MTGEESSTTKTFRFSYPTCTNEEVLFKLEVPVCVPAAARGARELVQRLIAMFHIPVYLEDELNEKLAQFIAEETKRFHDERDAALLARLRGVGPAAGERAGGPAAGERAGGPAAGERAGGPAAGERAGGPAAGERAGGPAAGERAGGPAAGERAGGPAAGERAGGPAAGERAGGPAAGERAGGPAAGERAGGPAAGEGAEGAVRRWERRYKERVAEFVEHKGTSDEEVFAAMYHKLVHSPALESVLRAEAAHAAAVRSAVAARDRDIQQLTMRQTVEMEEKIRLLNTSTTEEEINALAARQFEEQSLAAARWGSQLDALRHAQRAQHRAALQHALQHAAPPPLSPLSPLPPAAREAGEARQEESFTIHLGSQLKQTHNIRIVALDVRDLLDARADNAAAESRQLQAALALYSGELSGAVVLCAGDRGLRTGDAADHHFPPLDQQLQALQDLTREPISARNAARHQRQQAAGGAARARPQTGDVLVTRHGNLPGAHVVFHLVLDADERLSGEMTSRHPAILGLRSVLQGASCNDITSLALPLLLRHDLTEEMTAAWCARRAELVLKCVKGFMLEAAGGGGAQLNTLTLCVPRDLAPPVFAALRALLPAVFRLSTPLKIKPRA